MTAEQILEYMSTTIFGRVDIDMIQEWYDRPWWPLYTARISGIWFIRGTGAGHTLDEALSRAFMQYLRDDDAQRAYQDKMWAELDPKDLIL